MQWLVDAMVDAMVDVIHLAYGVHDTSISVSTRPTIETAHVDQIISD